MTADRALFSDGPRKLRPPLLLSVGVVKVLAVLLIWPLVIVTAAVYGVYKLLEVVGSWIEWVIDEWMAQ